MQPRFELAQVIRAQWKAIEQSVVNKSLNTWQMRTLSALGKCRTKELGGHIDSCTDCGILRISYNSCRNRHCPKCQGNERERWVQAREKELLPVGYFHVVFTLPSELNALCMQYPSIMYASLFDAAWDTINTFAQDPKHLGATTGMISILHTWGQQLTLHPHLHCIIPAGGLTKDGKWKHSKKKGEFLFNVTAMSPKFRGKFFHHVRKRMKDPKVTNGKQITIPKQVSDACFTKPWVIYAKQPFSGVNSVVEYLGRYTHKIAISNHRIVKIDEENDSISFRYKDYKDSDKVKLQTLKSMEFIRRFCLHILPKSFVRIRHYGILSSTAKTKSIPKIRKQLPAKKSLVIVKTLAVAYNPLVCPCCNKETMRVQMHFDHRGPPKNYKEILKQRMELMKED